MCELCGAEGELFRAKVEGTELTVCRNCGKFGKIFEPVRERKDIPEKKADKKEAAEEPLEMVVGDFSKIIREKREGLGLSQKDFAKKINEKESFLHKMETGELKPSIDTSRKLEKILGIKLVEEYKEEHDKRTNLKSDVFTIGDFVKIRKR